MADITMCANKKCTSKGECYRSRATPNEFQQSYASFKFSEPGLCDHFITIKGRTIEIQKTKQ